MAAIQLNFTLRTSTNCKTVHLVGSWDSYGGQLPLSKDTTKSGGWKGTFRFQGATLKQGSRYWYYYIIDGYHVSHDPARDSTTEPTTGRKLNVLDIPGARPAPSRLPASGAPASGSTKQYQHRQQPHSRSNPTRYAADVPSGRALSPSQIQSPKPTKPHATRRIAAEHYDRRAVEQQLAARIAAQRLGHSPAQSSRSDDSSTSSDNDDDSSDVPSLGSSRSSNTSSPRSASSTSGPGGGGGSGGGGRSSRSSASSASSCCTCERYGITRGGNRVKLDCGGARCGGESSGGSGNSAGECSSESDRGYRRRTTRRQGVVVRR